VRERLQSGTLLSVPEPVGERLPRAKFAPGGGTIPGIERVLTMMSVKSAWIRVQLFFDDDAYGALQVPSDADAVVLSRSAETGARQ
jgi:hypothetical protein